MVCCFMETKSTLKSVRLNEVIYDDILRAVAKNASIKKVELEFRTKEVGEMYNMMMMVLDPNTPVHHIEEVIIDGDLITVGPLVQFLTGTF